MFGAQESDFCTFGYLLISLQEQAVFFYSESHGWDKIFRTHRRNDD